MISLLNRLCLLPGVSGDEAAVREFILSEIKGHAEAKVDPLGNIIVFKKGKNTPALRLMYCAHMDEVGFIITSITDEGYLKFAAVGGIDEQILPGQRVKVGEKLIAGVIGVKPVHLLSKEEKNRPIKETDLYIDIGAIDKEDAQSLVKLGDTAVFDCDFVEFGASMIKSKALDDRAGCTLMLNLIKSDLPYDMYFAFTTGEEVGLRGAQTASYNIKPDIAVVIETTTAADYSGVDIEKQVCRLGQGAVISFMDGRTLYDKDLYNYAVKTAKENNIKWQTKEYVSGGNDAGAIETSLAGVKVLALSAPCRYLHTPSCVLNLNDLYEMEKLLLKLSYLSGGDLYVR